MIDENGTQVQTGLDNHLGGLGNSLPKRTFRRINFRIERRGPVNSIGSLKTFP